MPVTWMQGEMMPRIAVAAMASPDLDVDGSFALALSDSNGCARWSWVLFLIMFGLVFPPRAHLPHELEALAAFDNGLAGNASSPSRNVMMRWMRDRLVTCRASLCMPGSPRDGRGRRQTYCGVG